MRSATIRYGVKLGFGIHLHIANKYILYVKADDVLEKAQYEKLYQKNIRMVYVREDEKAGYEAFMKNLETFDIKDKNMSVEEKTQIVTSITKSAVEDMQADPTSAKNFAQTQNAANKQVGLIMDQPSSLEKLLQEAAYDRTAYQHSVNVATIAIGLATWLGATEQICQVVGLGSLLHDIGKQENKIPANLPVEEMTPEQKTLYLEHPRRAAEVLADKKYVSKDVLDIILLHEERLDGKGFPGGVNKLDQIFQVVGLANMYDREVTLMGKNPKAVYESIQVMDPPPYDKDMIDGLKEVLVANHII